MDEEITLEIHHGDDFPLGIDFGSDYDLTGLKVYLRAKRNSHLPDSELVIDISQTVHIGDGQTSILIPKATVNALAVDHQHFAWIQVQQENLEAVTVGSFYLIKRAAPVIV